MKKTKELLPDEARNFLTDHIVELRLLEKKIRAYSTIDSIETLEELMARKRAKEIISEWISEIWGFTIEDISIEEDETSIFEVLNKED